MITLREIIQALDYIKTGRYLSIACFADDVAEILMRAGRYIPDDSVYQPTNRVRPGVYETEVDGETYMVYLRKPGIVEVMRPDNKPRFSDIQPYNTLCVQRAEKEKGDTDLRQIFALLKRTADKVIGDNRCFILEYQGSEWGAYDNSINLYVRWIKDALWPEGDKR